MLIYETNMVMRRSIVIKLYVKSHQSRNAKGRLLPTRLLCTLAYTSLVVNNLRPGREMLLLASLRPSLHTQYCGSSRR